MAAGQNKIRPEVAERLQETEDILRESGAIVSDAGIMDPAVEILEEERRQEFEHEMDRDPKFALLMQRSRAQEKVIAELTSRLDQFAKATGSEGELASFRVRQHQQEEWFRSEMKRIREQQQGKAVIIVGPDPDSPSSPRPITGSVNFRKFTIQRGTPTLCDIAVMENLWAQRVVSIAPYVDADGKKRKRFVDKARCPFMIQPPTANPQARAW